MVEVTGQQLVEIKTAAERVLAVGVVVRERLDGVLEIVPKED